MNIIRHSETVRCVRYTRSFEWIDCPGGGFAFESDENGNVDVSKLTPAQLASWRVATDKSRCIDEGLRVERWSYHEPAVGRCVCGRQVALARFTNACDCGRDYNGSGQLLAPREQWGEETGETAADIANL
jgi:hypothetical protein